MAQDQAGLAHVAVPLSLGGQYVGALIAGQVFTVIRNRFRCSEWLKSMGFPRNRSGTAQLNRFPSRAPFCRCTQNC